MHPDIARQAFERLGQHQQLAHVLFVALALGQERLHFARRLQRDELARLERNQLGDAVAERVAEIEHATDVADDRFRCHRAERRDLRHRVGTVLLTDVLDDAIATVLTEIDVEIGHRHTLGIEEALEQELVLQRIEIGDPQAVGDERTRPGPTPGPDRNTIVARPADEVGDDQEVAGEAHLHDRLQLELEALAIRRFTLVALCCLRITLREPTREADARLVVQMLVEGHTVRRRECGQVIGAERDREVATLRNFDRVGEGFRTIGEQRRHLVLRLQILLRRESALTTLVGKDRAFGDAHTRLVRREVFSTDELHRMRCDDRQSKCCCDIDRGRIGFRVVGPAGALQFDVIAIRKPVRPLPREGDGGVFVTKRQQRSELACVRSARRA